MLYLTLDDLSLQVGVYKTHSARPRGGHRYVPLVHRTLVQGRTVGHAVSDTITVTVRADCRHWHLVDVFNKCIPRASRQSDRAGVVFLNDCTHGHFLNQSVEGVRGLLCGHPTIGPAESG